MAFPVFNPFLQFFDNSGNVLAGGLLYTYAPGTTTPKTTYTDENLSVANANPIVLDSADRCAIFLSDGEEYNYVLKTRGGIDYLYHRCQAPFLAQRRASAQSFIRSQRRKRMPA